MTQGGTDLLTVVSALYDAVLDEEKWLSSLQSAAQFIGGHAVFHIIADSNSGAVVVSEQVGIDPVANDLYQRHYALKDIRIPSALAYGIGIPVTEWSLLDRKIYEKSEIYSEMLVPNDIPHIAAMWLQRTSSACQALVIEAGVRHGAFDQSAINQFSLLAPHLVRVAKMREKLQCARHEIGLSEDVLSRLPVSLISLSRTGTVLTVSARAEQALRLAQGLRLKNGRLYAQFADDDRRLQRALLHTLKPDNSGQLPGATLRLRRGGNAPALGVTVLPTASSQVITVTPQPAALLILTDFPQSIDATTFRLAEALNLTEAEAKLAAVLFTGVSLREAAQSLGKSFHTCKTQLRSIYQKTGSTNHVDLTKALMMSTVVQLNGADER